MQRTKTNGDIVVNGTSANTEEAEEQTNALTAPTTGNEAQPIATNGGEKNVSFDDTLIGPEDDADDEDPEPRQLSVGKEAQVPIVDGGGVIGSKKKKRKPKSKRGLVDSRHFEKSGSAYICVL